MVKRKKHGLRKISKSSSEINAFGRQRLNISVLDTNEFSTIPTCSHGPCLLFQDGTNRRWFACAVFRQSNECKFKLSVNADNKLLESDITAPRIFTNSLTEYGNIRKSFDHLKNENIKRYWCHKCLNYVGIPHVDPVIGPYHEFLAPSKLLAALQNDKGEAQYWFSAETLEILKSALRNADFDSVLCIGAPTVFESLASSQFRRFLLDVDDRMSAFYDRSEFARYSMLVNYFFHKSSEEDLARFFANSKKLAIICDPPFGIYVTALLRSLENLKRSFIQMKKNQNGTDFKFILFLPIFVGKHILRERTEFSMVDYKVTYENHKEFSKADRSIVRIFTDVENKLFELPLASGYRFCGKCDRFVCEANNHCQICDRCTSKDGSKWVHCDLCANCVKATYSHCPICKICHLKNRCVSRRLKK